MERWCNVCYGWVARLKLVDLVAEYVGVYAISVLQIMSQGGDGVLAKKPINTSVPLCVVRYVPVALGAILVALFPYGGAVGFVTHVTKWLEFATPMLPLKSMCYVCRGWWRECCNICNALERATLPEQECRTEKE